MIYLTRSSQAFGSKNFEPVFKQELSAQSDFRALLQHAMQYGSCALFDDLDIMLNNIELDEDNDQIHVRVGAFYHSIIAGCNCADDPSPVEKNNEYTELCIRINRHRGEAILKSC